MCFPMSTNEVFNMDSYGNFPSLKVYFLKYGAIKMLNFGIQIFLDGIDDLLRSGFNLITLKVKHGKVTYDLCDL